MQLIWFATSHSGKTFQETPNEIIVNYFFYFFNIKKLHIGTKTFSNPIFCFWLLVTFGHFWQQSYKSTKLLRNLCLHFGRQDWQDGKKRKENHATKVTKIPKNENMGRTKQKSPKDLTRYFLNFKNRSSSCILGLRWSPNLQ